MAINVDTITLRRPDDWHVHLRDGAMLAAVIPFTARHFAPATASWPCSLRVPHSRR